MKLIVQIPCYNEESTLAETVAAIPRRIDGIDRVEVLIIDDGSQDGTLRVAREAGVDHVVRHTRNRGLGQAFQSGLDACLRLGADIIVNTDADHQYPGAEIPRLIAPILSGEAEIVVGDRQTASIAHFSPLKKFLQWLGSGVVRKAAGVWVPDAVSGFRAISRQAALQINIFVSFSYTIDMLIQAGKKRMAVVSVPISTNPKVRESRLFSSVPMFIANSLSAILRTYVMYKPLRAFFYVGLVLGLIGLLPIVRFLVYSWQGEAAGHVQSLVLGGVLLMMGFLTWMMGVVTDLLSVNRQLAERILERVKRLEREAERAAEESTGQDGEKPVG